MVEASLVAANASVDLVGRASRSLGQEERVRQEGPRHRDQIRMAGAENLLGDLGSVNTVGGDKSAGKGRGVIRRAPLFAAWQQRQRGSG